MNKELAVAVNAFAETLEELGVTSRRRGLTKPKEMGRRAALGTAAEAIFRQKLGRLLTRDEAQELLGVRTRQAIHDLVKRGRLIAIPTRSGSYVYPAFQIDVGRGRAYPAVGAAITELRKAFDRDSMTIAGWFVSENELLEDMTPAEWLRTGGAGDLVVEAARRDAGAAAH